MRLFIPILIVLWGLMACSGQSEKSDNSANLPAFPGSGPFPPSGQRETAFIYPDDLKLTKELIASNQGSRDQRAPASRDFFDDMSVRRMVTVSTFNIPRSDTDQRRTDAHFQELASLLRKHDVIVVLGRQSTGGANRLMNVLIEDQQPWGALYPAETGDSANREAPLILWKRDRLQLTAPGGYIDTDMARDPYWAAFRVKVDSPQAFDFVLLSAHARAEQESEVRQLARVVENLRQDISTESGAIELGLDAPESDILLVGTFNAGVQPQGEPVTASDDSFQNFFGFTYGGPPPLPAKAIVQWPTQTLGSRSIDNVMWWSASDEDFAQVRGMDHVSRPTVSKHQPVWAGFHLDRDTN